MPRGARARQDVGLMAVLVVGVAMLLSAAHASIDLDPAQITAAAAEANVDPTDLEGALVTVGQPDPRTYLRHAGQLPWPAPPPAPFGVWDRLAQCESGGNWHIDAYHDGGLQFLPSTWTAYGGGQYARYAWQATREQQIAIAIKVQAAAGWGQWPVCSRRIGVR